MEFKTLSLIAAVSAALGMGAMTQAQASSSAGQSEMSISNFIITGAGTTPLDFGAFSQLSFLDTLANTAQLAGIGGAAGFDSSGSFQPEVNAPQACVGACSKPEDFYTPQPIPPSPTTTFSRSDSILKGAPITGTPVGAAGVTANTIAETLINGNGSGGSTADISLTSSFTFKLASATVVGVIFDAATYLRSWTNTGSGSPTSAGADFKWEITISRNIGGINTVVADWIPNGVVGTGTETGFTVTQEDCNLNLNSSAGPNQPFGANTCSGHFNAHTTAALLGDTQYSLTIAQHVTSQAVAIAAVPEPSTIALLGLGLFGISGFARKRKNS